MPAKHEDNSRLTFELSNVDHKKLKAIAALEGVSLKELISSCLKETLLRENLPNQDTIKVFTDTDLETNLNHYENIKHLIEKLELN